MPLDYESSSSEEDESELCSHNRVNVIVADHANSESKQAKENMNFRLPYQTRSIIVLPARNSKSTCRMVRNDLVVGNGLMRKSMIAVNNNESDYSPRSTVDVHRRRKVEVNYSTEFLTDAVFDVTGPELIVRKRQNVQTTGNNAGCGSNSKQCNAGIKSNKPVQNEAPVLKWKDQPFRMRLPIRGTKKKKVFTVTVSKLIALVKDKNHPLHSWADVITADNIAALPKAYKTVFLKILSKFLEVEVCRM